MADSRALARLSKICLALPEATSDESHPPHRGFAVGKKTFCWYLENHHGDNRLSIQMRAPTDENQALVASDSERFGLPKYMAHHGWVEYFIDLKHRPPDWDEVAELVTDSYRLQAPKKLAKLLE